MIKKKNLQNELKDVMNLNYKYRIQQPATFSFFAMSNR